MYSINKENVKRSRIVLESVVNQRKLLQLYSIPSYYKKKNNYFINLTAIVNIIVLTLDLITNIRLINLYYKL